LEEAKIEFIQSKIIYHISERIEKIVSGMLDPKEVEEILGQATVGGIFYTSKEFSVIGLILKEGNNIEDKALIRVIR
jgi:translation initiation factor IF-2